MLRRRDVAAALVSSGGSTIYALGAPPGRDGWDVMIQDPIDPGKIAFTVQLKDRALSVAGSSEKSFEAGGITYSHIMDPRAGRPAQGVLSVAVLASSGTASTRTDYFALPTAVQLPGDSALFVFSDCGQARISASFFPVFPRSNAILMWSFFTTAFLNPR